MSAEAREKTPKLVDPDFYRKYKHFFRKLGEPISRRPYTPLEVIAKALKNPHQALRSARRYGVTIFH